MGHSLTKTAMGSTPSSAKDVSEHSGNPSTYPAGTAVRLTSADALSTTKSAGSLLGVSLGKSLSDTSKISVARSGLRVPILLETQPARGIVTITSYANLVAAGDDTLLINATTLTFKASPTTENHVLCAASGSSNSVVASALKDAINAHSVLSTLFVASVSNAIVTITALNNATVGSTIALVYTDNGTATVGATVDAATFTGGGASADFVTIGAKVYISDTTGKADDANSGATLTKAFYVSGAITGYDESGAAVSAALIDMPRGL